MHISEDSGSTWKSGASDYGFANAGLVNAGTQNYTDTAESFMALSDNTASAVLSNGASDSYCGEIIIYNPASTTFKKVIRGSTSYITSGGAPKDIMNMTIAGQYQGTTNAINGFRFFMESGNIAVGTFRLWGLI